MNKSTRSYQAELLKALADPKEAAAYLNAALEEDSPELFLLALRNIAEARNLKKENEDLNSLPCRNKHGSGFPAP
jgi:DNA-binding phage protein